MNGAAGLNRALLENRNVTAVGGANRVEVRCELVQVKRLTKHLTDIFGDSCDSYGSTRKAQIYNEKTEVTARSVRRSKSR